MVRMVARRLPSGRPAASRPIDCQRDRRKTFTNHQPIDQYDGDGYGDNDDNNDEPPTTLTEVGDGRPLRVSLCLLRRLEQLSSLMEKLVGPDVGMRENSE